jgi:Response regulator of the LytR/AlgR family
MTKIAICDDNLLELESIHDMVNGFIKENPEIDFSVKCFNAACELLTYIEDGGRFQIYLLDIVMPTINGIDIGESIRKRDDLAIIIYLTSSREYALKSFSVFAFQYLLKPVASRMLCDVLGKALLKINLEKSKIISVKTKEGIAAIRYHEIVYVEYKNHSLLFYLLDGSTLSTVSTREPFERTVNVLLDDSRFARPHVSFVINMQHAHSIAGKNFLMINGSQISISNKNYKVIKNRYMEYLLGKGDQTKC